MPSAYGADRGILGLMYGILARAEDLTVGGKLHMYFDADNGLISVEKGGSIFFSHFLAFLADHPERGRRVSGALY